MGHTNPLSDDTRTIPVLEETLDIQQRRVETGGVRVTKVVHEHEEVVTAPRMREEVTVERVSLNRIVEAPVLMRQEGDTLIIPVLEEVVVMEKRLMVKEELRITKRRIEEQTTETVTLRRAEAVVERLGPPEHQSQNLVKESTDG